MMANILKIICEKTREGMDSWMQLYENFFIFAVLLEIVENVEISSRHIKLEW